MTNPLKFLPKLYKRDKVSGSIVFYAALVDNVATPQFSKKCDLIKYLTQLQRDNTIKSIVITKTTVQTLIH